LHHEGIFAQPLNALFVSNLVKQSGRRDWITRVKNKDAIIADTLVDNWRISRIFRKMPREFAVREGCRLRSCVLDDQKLAGRIICRNCLGAGCKLDQVKHGVFPNC